MKFDNKKFKTAIIEKKFAMGQKQKRHIGLRELGKTMNVSSATLSRVMRGNDCDTKTKMSILTWLNQKFDNFIKK